VQAKRNKEWISISRQLFGHPQESRALSHVAVTWEDKSCNSECLPLPLALTAEHKVLLVRWGQLSPPKFLCTPSLEGSSVRNTKGLDAVYALFWNS